MHKQAQGAAAANATRMSVRIGAGDEATTFSAGIERFIGPYARLEGVCAPGQVLKFKRLD